MLKLNQTILLFDEEGGDMKGLGAWKYPYGLAAFGVSFAVIFHLCLLFSPIDMAAVVSAWDNSVPGENVTQPKLVLVLPDNAPSEVRMIYDAMMTGGGQIYCFPDIAHGTVRTNCSWNNPYTPIKNDVIYVAEESPDGGNYVILEMYWYTAADTRWWEGKIMPKKIESLPLVTLCSVVEKHLFALFCKKEVYKQPSDNIMLYI
ncbi:MAG TPA: hypothetical protein VJB56_02430 [Candidatus Paceibacterota bacterium]|uniref:Uncharacterized protein n=1 Tax=Candidatus Giovannonibacteria bacterium RIFCSPLOWO2_01_FULL_46_32 TaxID=1798353 RepID=A0A1F5XI28_9BACT|nr:MAG: hypothetical protein A3B19_01955 [Candidatus Giovannonibacteria bacterium RIFCSPLOWO2_01_FULL_46_32]